MPSSPETLMVNSRGDFVRVHDLQPIDVFHHRLVGARA